eukprot:3206423-Rhodomonas_salina.2
MHIRMRMLRIRAYLRLMRAYLRVQPFGKPEEDPESSRRRRSLPPYAYPLHVASVLNLAASGLCGSRRRGQKTRQDKEVPYGVSLE